MLKKESEIKKELTNTREYLKKYHNILWKPDSDGKVSSTALEMLLKKEVLEWVLGKIEDCPYNVD